MIAEFVLLVVLITSQTHAKELETIHFVLQKHASLSKCLISIERLRTVFQQGLWTEVDKLLFKLLQHELNCSHS